MKCFTLGCDHEQANHQNGSGACMVNFCQCGGFQSPFGIAAAAPSLSEAFRRYQDPRVAELETQLAEEKSKRDAAEKTMTDLVCERAALEQRISDLESAVIEKYGISLDARGLPFPDQKPLKPEVAITAPGPTPEQRARREVGPISVSVSSGAPLENPKHHAGSKKTALWLVPPALEIAAARALTEGAELYGPYNWRQIPVRMTDYISAMRRHASQMLDGEDVDPESVSGKTHLDGLIACAAILADSIALGIVVDDRPPRGPAPDLLRDKQKLARAARAREAALVQARVDAGAYDVLAPEPCTPADTSTKKT